MIESFTLRPVFSEKDDFLEKILKEGGGSKAIKKIPEIHPFLKRQASLSEMGSTVLALFKVQGPSLPLTTKLHLNWERALAPTPKISPAGHACIPWCMEMETAPVGANIGVSIFYQKRRQEIIFNYWDSWDIVLGWQSRLVRFDLVRNSGLIWLGLIWCCGLFW